MLHQFFGLVYNNNNLERYVSSKTGIFSSKKSNKFHIAFKTVYAVWQIGNHTFKNCNKKIHFHLPTATPSAFSPTQRQQFSVLEHCPSHFAMHRYRQSVPSVPRLSLGADATFVPPAPAHIGGHRFVGGVSLSTGIAAYAIEGETLKPL